MVFQVIHVVCHEIIQSRWLVQRDRFPRDLVEVVDSPRLGPFRFRRCFHDSGDMQVQAAPETHEFNPRRDLVLLRSHPGRAKAWLRLTCVEHTLPVMSLRQLQTNRTVKAAHRR